MSVLEVLHALLLPMYFGDQSILMQYCLHNFFLSVFSLLLFCIIDVPMLLSIQVSRRIIETAGFIYECERCVNRHMDSLRDAAEYIKEISDIDTASWDLLKIVTALKMSCFPKEKVSFPRGVN